MANNDVGAGSVPPGFTPMHAPTAPDALTVGRRIRAARVERGWSLQQLADAVGKAISQVSLIENGKRELRVGELRQLATIFDLSVDELLDPTPPNRRAELEIALTHAQEGVLYRSLGLPELPVRKSLSDEAIETILRLHDELVRIHNDRAATPEEARRVNGEIRAEQRAAGNYYPQLEATARELLAAIDHTRGPVSQRGVAELAAHLGFTLHYVGDLPHSTRSITDAANHRIYLPVRPSSSDPRSTVLQALAAAVLGKREPRDYGELLRQRVETNYLAAAILIPEASAVTLLREAKQARALSVEDLRDEFSVSYEVAAHRFSNLATRHLEIPVHFLKVHSSGAILKAYENDDVQFPSDPLGTVEGQLVCKEWSARQVFRVEDRMSPYYQYTDKPVGTYWCTSRIEASAAGEFSISVGTRFADARWFRGRETRNRRNSRCPDTGCCREPEAALAAKWADAAWPSARLKSSLLAAMPTGTFTGIDRVAVLEFLERHAPQ